jgi:fermentation-respiration switch protein FrsA (DUF1100 family)
VIIVENKCVEQIPVLHIVRKELFADKLPFVMFVHGFTSAKEHNLHYAYLLAEKGFRVVLPEAAYHGERHPEGVKTEEIALHFWNIVLQTIDELDVLRQYFDSENLIDTKRIGLVGTSMGGIVTLGSLTRYQWIKAAVSLMGMPQYGKYALWQLDMLKKQGVNLPIQQEEIDVILEKLKPVDLSRHPEVLANRPLLFWHGKQDPIVPFSYTYDFYEKIKPLYKKAPEKLHFMIDEKSGHKVSREGLLKTVEWFDTFLV